MLLGCVENFSTPARKIQSNAGDGQIFFSKSVFYLGYFDLLTNFNFEK